MNFDSLYCVPLSPAEEDLLRERVRARRADYLRGLLPRALDSDTLARVGGLAPRLLAFLERLLPLATRDPAAFRRIADHWSTGYLIRQLVEGDDQTAHFERAVCLLESTFLSERVFEDDGSVEHVAPWNLMVIDGPGTLGLQAAHRVKAGAATEPRASATFDGGAPPAAESLAAAYAFLDQIWPEVLPWAAALVPAYLDLGEPPSRDCHTSGSYGTGYPIFVTRVYDAFLHAEDVLHEVQHCRLFMLDGAGLFRSWRDERTRFVSPYRPDPRPLRGLVLGLHAFLAVNRLRLLAAERGLRPLDAPRTRPLFKAHRANLFVFRTLVEDHQVLPAGAALVASMANELVAQDRAIEELAPREFHGLHDEAFLAHTTAVQGAADGALVNASPAHVSWRETVRLAADYAQAKGMETADAH
jgi:hypothetical protein